MNHEVEIDGDNKIIHFLAREFLENSLCIDANDELVRLFATHIIEFEKEVTLRKSKSMKSIPNS